MAQNNVQQPDSSVGARVRPRFLPIAILIGAAVAAILLLVFPNLRDVPAYFVAVVLTPLLAGLCIGLLVSGLWRAFPRAATRGASAALLAVLALDTIFFASPLFISGTTGTDSAPAFANPTASSAPAQATPSATLASPVTRSGMFDARPGVETVAGTAVLGTTTDGKTVLRLQQLKSANGPDLYVYLTKVSSPRTRSDVEGGYQVGKLKATRGDSNYELPDNVDASQYQAVVVYCRSFSAIFGYANLS